MQKAMENALHTSGLRETMQRLVDPTKPQGSARLSERHSITTQAGLEASEEDFRSTKSTSHQPPKVHHKTSINSTGGEFRSRFGKLSWRFRTIRTTYTDYELETNGLETYICWQPAQWLLRRSIGIIISRGDLGHTYKIVSNRRVPDDAPIWNLLDYGPVVGVVPEMRRLFKSGLASPLDVRSDGMTALHVRAHCFGPSAIADDSSMQRLVSTLKHVTS